MSNLRDGLSLSPSPYRHIALRSVLQCRSHIYLLFMGNEAIVLLEAMVALARLALPSKSNDRIHQLEVLKKGDIIVSSNSVCWRF